MKTLYLRKMGMNFREGEELAILSDIGNHRVTTCDSAGGFGYIQGKDGRKYFLEFTQWTRYNYRDTHKITGKPLKHWIRELENPCALHISTQYDEEKDGFTFSYRNSILEKDIHDMHLTYTCENILKVVNLISRDHFDAITFID